MNIHELEKIPAQIAELRKLIEQVRIAHGFDLVRLSRAKAIVDISPNTIRAYAKQGLRLYRCGKPVFFSRAELNAFILAQSVKE